MKRITVFLICIALIAGCICSAHAALPPLQIGDVDSSYDLDITDATLIQRFLAGIGTPTELQTALADVDGDGEMTVLDVTLIQRKLADIPCNFVEGDIYDYYIGDASFHNTAEIQNAEAYSSSDDVCYVGVPVTFTAKVIWGAEPRSYQFFIDDVLVAEKAANGNQQCEYTTTFNKAGNHTVITKAICKYGATTEHRDNIIVQNLPDNGNPVIMGATFFDASNCLSGEPVLTVTAVGGSGSYQYEYRITQKTTVGEYDMDIPYCESNEVTVNFLEESSYYNFDDETIVTVTVRDSNGKTSEPVTVKYQPYHLIG